MNTAMIHQQAQETVEQHQPAVIYQTHKQLDRATIILAKAAGNIT